MKLNVHGFVTTVIANEWICRFNFILCVRCELLHKRFS